MLSFFKSNKVNVVKITNSCTSLLFLKSVLWSPKHLPWLKILFWYHTQIPDGPLFFMIIVFIFMIILTLFNIWNFLRCISGVWCKELFVTHSTMVIGSLYSLIKVWCNFFLWGKENNSFPSHVEILNLSLFLNMTMTIHKLSHNGSLGMNGVCSNITLEWLHCNKYWFLYMFFWVVCSLRHIYGSSGIFYDAKKWSYIERNGTVFLLLIQRIELFSFHQGTFETDKVRKMLMVCCSAFLFKYKLGYFSVILTD